MELLKAQKLCIELMNQHGLTKEKGWTFEWFKSKNTAGRCSYRGVSRFFGGIHPEGGQIKLSNIITLARQEETVRNTILHEIAHGLTKGHGHDGVWVRKAMSIGCDGKRCFTACEGVKELQETLSRDKYFAECPKCKQDFKMTRLPKRDQWCKCVRRINGRLPHDFKLVWKTIGTQHVATPKATPIPTPTIPILASRGFQQFKAHTSFPIQLLNQAPDSYKKMLDKFEQEFLHETSGDINREIFESIVREAKRSNSWRTMNREVRKACDAYCAKQNIMHHMQFQEKFFYEGVMIGRTTWGKNAPWI